MFFTPLYAIVHPSFGSHLCNAINKNTYTKNNKTMRGKYINTNIMMAALAGKRWRRINGSTEANGTAQVQEHIETKEPAVSFADYKIIWQKPARTEKQKPLYRCITACIY